MSVHVAVHVKQGSKNGCNHMTLSKSFLNFRLFKNDIVQKVFLYDKTKGRVCLLDLFPDAFLNKNNSVQSFWSACTNKCVYLRNIINHPRTNVLMMCCVTRFSMIYFLFSDVGGPDWVCDGGSDWAAGLWEVNRGLPTGWEHPE